MSAELPQVSLAGLGNGLIVKRDFARHLGGTQAK
jgi:hypothetical protein